MQLSLHGLSRQFGCKLAELTDSTCDVETVAYGMEILLGAVIKISILFATAACFGLIKETAVVLVVTGLMRTFSGGAHCTAYYRCMVTSTLILVTLALAGRAAVELTGHPASLFLLMLLSVSSYLYWRFSPQAPPNKPLPDTAAERISWMVTMFLVLIFAAISLTPGSGQIRWCIALGLFWQAVSLTRLGHHLVSSVDHLLTVKLKGGVMQ